MSALSGQTIKTYQCHELIAQGGSGEVYRATELQTGQDVAVKVLRPDQIAQDGVYLERFWRESQILQQLDHPNIVQMVDAFEHQGQFCIVMEYARGGSLRDLVRRHPLPPLEHTLTIALELADALTRAHHLGIIHRDLKPENVLLMADGSPCLADFGTAYLVGTPHVTHEGLLLGTPHYLSPEALNGKELDQRADIWSLGVILFELLTGQCPFDGSTFSTLALAILQAPVPDLETLRPGIPVALVDLVYRMVEKDREARLPSMRLVGAELEAIIQGTNLASRIGRRTLHDGTSVFATPVPEPGTPRHNLPSHTTPFVGREDELAELTRLLSNPAARLITILGSGGMGKTRLALEAAARLLDHTASGDRDVPTCPYHHGVFFVSLAPLADPASIPTAIADAVGFQFWGGTLGGTAPGTLSIVAKSSHEQLLDYFRTKQMLLVLDNFEHLVHSAALLSDIVQAAPGVKILATSRERLNLSSESLFNLGGMEFPDWETPEDALQYDAVKLFMQSARRVQPGFELQARDLRYVARICRLVEGMPLGILLAAAWVDMFSVEEIAHEISQSIDFLETTLRDVPERHRSMRAVFDSAWNQLSESEQIVFEHLSVFRGGFTREAARQVADADLRALTGLVNKSLLRRDPGTGRYETHELLRQCAALKLDEAPDEREAILDRHCAYYTDFLSQRETQLWSGHQHEVLSEIDNLRAAWERALEHLNLTTICQLRPGVHAVHDFQLWSAQGRDLFALAVKVLHSAQPSPERNRALGEMLAEQGYFTGWAGGLAAGTAMLREGIDRLQALDARPALAWAQVLLVRVLGGQHSSEKQRYLEDSLTYFHETGDSVWSIYCLLDLGWLMRENGDPAGADRPYQAALALARATGDRWCQVIVLANLSGARIALSEWAEASQFLQEALALAQQSGYKAWEALCHNNLAYTHLGLGELDQAERCARRAVAFAQEYGDTRLHVQVRDTLADVRYAQGAVEDARQLYLQNLTDLEQFSAFPFPSIPYAKKQLGFCALVQDDLAAALQYFEQALDLASDIGEVTTTVDTLVGLAALAAHEDDHVRAVELLALTMPYKGSDKHQRDETRLRAELETVLPPEVFAAAWERGAARTLDDVVAELLGKEPTRKAQPLVNPLSERELEVLHLLGTGLSNREIAEALVVSVGTVKAHTHSIYGKLDVDTRTRAIVRARELGLL